METTQPRIVMLLSNPFRPDPRVLKEAESLQNAGFRVTIICWDRQAEYSLEETLASGVQVIRIQNVESAYGIGLRQVERLLRFWKSAYKIANQIKPDCIHCHDFDTLLPGLLWGKLHHKPVIYDSHEYYAELIKPRLSGLTGSLVYKIVRGTEQLAARSATAIVTVDDQLGNIYRRIKGSVIILRHYPPLRRFKERAQVFSRPHLTLVYVGRLSEDRGLITYLELLGALRRLTVPARLCLAGVFTPADEEQIFRKHVKGLEKYVEMAGWLQYDQLAEFLLSADVGLVLLQPLPRYVAAVPVKLFEYMGSGLPVIANNFPAIIDIVNGANCGALVSPNTSPDDIASIIQDWWEHPDVPRNLGLNGRNAVLQQFHWEKDIDQLIQLYYSLTSR